MANDYYDFNPSPTTWAIMLTGVVIFTVALCVIMIVAISRAEASSVTARSEAPETDDATVPASRQPAAVTEAKARPTARSPKARPA